MQIGMIIRIVVALGLLGQTVALYFMSNSLNSARTQRDTAIERSNSQAETVRLLRAELNVANDNYRTAIEQGNNIVDNLLLVAAESKKTNSALASSFRNDAAKWGKISSSLRPIDAGDSCESRLQNIDNFLTRFYGDTAK